MYNEYKSLLGDIPDFLYDYIDLDIFLRLKNISFLCGMDYASKDIYDFPYYISRYDHSIGVALITYYLTRDEKMTLAALYHDISTPVFSHVVDYMNNDYIEQSSTENKTKEILNSSTRLRKLLDRDNISIDDISDFKKYSVVDLDRPKLCADRLDGTISTAINWTKNISMDDITEIIGDIKLFNIGGEEEIGLNKQSSALKIKNLNDSVNKSTHSKEDIYMMLLASKIIKECIANNYFSYDDLYRMTEPEVISIIEEKIKDNEVLSNEWTLFKFIKKESIADFDMPKVKNKVLYPLYGKGIRLN